MDAVWIRTVHRLEIDLAKYHQMRRDNAVELNPDKQMFGKVNLDRMRKNLNLRYSQIIAFTAGLSDADVAFDCDLGTTAFVITRGDNVRYVFGPSAIRSTAPYLAEELREFVDRHRENSKKMLEQRSVSSDKEHLPSEFHSMPLAFSESIIASRTFASNSFSFGIEVKLGLLDYLNLRQQQRECFLSANQSKRGSFYQFKIDKAGVGKYGLLSVMLTRSIDERHHPFGPEPEFLTLDPIQQS